MKKFILVNFYKWKVGKNGSLYKNGYKYFSADTIAYKYLFADYQAWSTNLRNLIKTIKIKINETQIQFKKTVAR